MALLKCKICGGTTNIDTKNGIITCEYCGTKQALPLFTDDSERLLYESGNGYLSQSEYDKAESVFNQLLTIKPNSAELYWDLVLCRYGVTYVKDPKTEKYIPTCNRTHYTPIFSDKNYLKAIELASDEKKALFEEDAKTIDNIQKGIIAVSKKEKPFDIFISYKETDKNGNRTKDSIEAQKLYEKLTEAGYKVFFSRITLEDKAGTEYEPYIYAALYSSKVLLAIGSRNENFEAVWVKNEWGRYLSLQQKSSDKTLIPLYFNMSKEELPEEFSFIPSFNMKEDGFEAELLRGIKKQIPLPIMKAKKRKAIKKAVTITALSILGAAVLCGAILIPGIIIENNNNKKYTSAMQLFENQNYTEAKPLFEELDDYENSEYMVERCEKQPEYDAAMQLYYDGNYAESAWAFAALADYEDSADMQKTAELSWRKLVSTPYDGYYVSENGVSSSDNAGTHSDVVKNGKVVSLKAGSEYSSIGLIALHENGNLTEAYHQSQIDANEELHDIIKVSHDLMYCGVVALRADGKMAIFTDDEYSSVPENLEPLLEWSNIVDFKTYYVGGNGLCYGLVMGLKADGTLCAIQVANFPLNETDVYGDNLCYNMDEINEILKNFKNVKSFCFEDDDSWTATAENLSITAITKDGNLATYKNGIYYETLEPDYIDVVTEEIVLKKNGDLFNIRSYRTILSNIAYAEKLSSGTYYAISKTGTVYSVSNYYGIEKTNITVTVHDEWTSRLK